VASGEEETVGGESLYSLYRRGMALLESGDFAQATVPLRKAARIDPDKTSIREALEAVVERYPVNDYAHFCLGRALTKTGRRDRARRHLAIAANLRPERKDYRIYRERLLALS
jgi:Flp pilus assembly protein TadD